MIKVGITERGDAGIDFTWVNKLKTVDGTILITKNINPRFITEVIKAIKSGHKIIVHATCTGWGGTKVEPNVPTYQQQIKNIEKLIEAGFPAENIVFRLDPILPSTEGIQRVKNVLNTIPKDISRIRISILDEYRHVKERFKANGLEPIYGNNFGPNTAQIQLVAKTLGSYPQYTFETCAEDKLAAFMTNVKATGCVGIDDLNIMGIKINDTMNTNPQNRFGCHCLACKTELLKHREQCPHKCLYCYWKN